MAEKRLLNPAERALARSVYVNSIPYDDIFISDLAIGETAVTLAGLGIPRGRFVYQICWPQGFFTTMDTAGKRATLIHELSQVWQGANGAWPTFYMGQSILDQLEAGIGDLVKQRKWCGWGNHRTGAYTIRASDFGRPWSSFGVEQQASIVESWYIEERVRRRYTDFGPGVYGGGMGQYDARFPYIRDVIRSRNRHAAYRRFILPSGGDATILEMQQKLVALGYLDARQADGLVGRGRSATLDAVAEFQRRNGLVADRDPGGAHSATRRKLALPINQLRAKP